MSPKLLFEIPSFQLDEYPLDDALGAKVRGEWETISTSAFIENIQNVSRGLLAKGVEKGEHVGIISFNRPEWNYIDLGLQQIGAINVPIYPNISKEAYQFILNDAGIKKLFIEDQELFNIIKDIKSEVNGLEEIYTFEPVEAAAHWSEVTQAATAAYDEQIEQRKSELKKWCQQHGVTWGSQDDVVQKERVIRRYDQIVNEKNEAFNHTEQVKEFRLVADEWTVENGVLTPTQKVKRPVIKEKYEDLINEMYET